MEPTLAKLNDQSLVPYLNGKITGMDAIRRGTQIHKHFMLRQTRKHDLALFAHLAKTGPIQTPDDTPITVFDSPPAFIISELKTAFVMGFCIYKSRSCWWTCGVHGPDVDGDDDDASGDHFYSVQNPAFRTGGRMAPGLVIAQSKFRVIG